jgi:polyisoprenoid-binding protein YceI
MHMKRFASIWLAGLISIPISAMVAGAATETGIMHFKINSTETKITASVAEPMAMFRGNADGTFSVISGDLQGNPNSVAETAKVNLVFDASSYQTDNYQRDEDVKSNALEVSEFPTITFESTRLSDIQKDGNTAKMVVAGRLTLHGVSKDIEVPVAAQVDNQGHFVADGSYAFKFEEYGVKRPSKMMGLMTTGDTSDDYVSCGRRSYVSESRLRLGNEVGPVPTATRVPAEDCDTPRRSIDPHWRSYLRFPAIRRRDVCSSRQVGAAGATVRQPTLGWRLRIHRPCTPMLGFACDSSLLPDEQVVRTGRGLMRSGGAYPGISPKMWRS